MPHTLRTTVNADAEGLCGRLLNKHESRHLVGPEWGKRFAFVDDARGLVHIQKDDLAAAGLVHRRHELIPPPPLAGAPVKFAAGVPLSIGEPMVALAGRTSRAAVFTPATLGMAGQGYEIAGGVDGWCGGHGPPSILGSSPSLASQ